MDIKLKEGLKNEFVHTGLVKKEFEFLNSEIERLKRGLLFYSSRHHFSFDGSVWDTVSGEPQNYWCDEQGTTVEDGKIAKLFLDGWDFDPDNEEGMIPPRESSVRVRTIRKGRPKKGGDG